MKNLNDTNTKAGTIEGAASDPTNQIERDPVIDIVCFLILGIAGAIFGIALLAFASPLISPWWGASLGIVTGMLSLYDENRINS